MDCKLQKYISQTINLSADFHCSNYSLKASDIGEKSQPGGGLNPQGICEEGCKLFPPLQRHLREQCQRLNSHDTPLQIKKSRYIHPSREVPHTGIAFHSFLSFFFFLYLISLSNFSEVSSSSLLTLESLVGCRYPDPSYKVMTHSS